MQQKRHPAHTFHKGSESRFQVNGDKEGAWRMVGGMALSNDGYHSREVCTVKIGQYAIANDALKTLTDRNCYHTEIALSISPWRHHPRSQCTP
jgi:hypothetical protein